MSSVSIYRDLARLAAGLIARDPGVVSVWARRGVAAGEVSLGRSDIDMSILVEPGTELAPLAARVRLMRTAVPVLGECQVHEPGDLQHWLTTDPYRGSIDRRAALVLHGPRPHFPDLPVSTAAAVRRAAFWLERYLPRAVRFRSTRTLRKIALEIRMAAAVATDELELPFVGRDEAERRWRTPGDRDGLHAYCMETLARLHAEVAPPLVPQAHGTDPRRRAALDLYVRYVNPFAHSRLPRSLELEPPSEDALRAGRRFFGSHHTLRSPGFTSVSPAVATARLDAALGRSARPGGRSLGDYYRRVYPAALADADALWTELDSGTS